MSLTTLRIASALLLATMAFIPTAAITTPVAAADDDVICFDYPLPGGGEETECGTVGDYKAECKLTDPDNTSEFCKGVNSASIRLIHAAIIAESQDDHDSSTEIDLPQQRQTTRR